MDREAFAERLASLRETRARLPELVRNRHASRHRRPVTAHDGRLLMIAADGPAGADLAAGGDPSGQADRGDLLHRLVTALGRPGVDGVIASADLIDDLLLLEVLEDRLVIGALNHGGLSGVAALEGRFTGYDAETVVLSHLDGGKLDLRIDPLEASAMGAVETCGRAVTSLAAGGVLAMVAPSWCQPGKAGPVPDLSVDALIRAVGVASGLGGRSQFTWLLLPAVDDVASVMVATTLPALLIAEEGPADEGRWTEALRVPGIRGVVLPSALLYPPDGDVAGAVDGFARLVHDVR
jgi:hypothetical protein